MDAIAMQPGNPKDLQLKFWDFTLNCEDNRDDSIQRCMHQYATHWAYQAEEAKRVHYNGRLQLIGKHGKRRAYEMAALFKGSPLEGAYWSITSTNGSKTFNYGLKADTRLRGPWTDLMSVPPDPKEAKEQEIVDVLRPFQKELLEIDLGPRTICWVYNPTKRAGKSEFMRHAVFWKKALCVPQHYTVSEAMKFISGGGNFRLYIWDLPAAWSATSKEAAVMYSTLESVKDGILSDWRHRTTQKTIKRPQIIVLSNALPECQRWREENTDRVEVFTIDPFNELVNYDPMDQPVIDEAWRKRVREEKVVAPGRPKKRSKLFL